MSQFVYDLVYVQDGDGTANLLTLKGLKIPTEVKNMCSVLGIVPYEDHIGWGAGDVVEAIVDQCPALGVKVREVSLSVFRYFQDNAIIEVGIEYGLRGADFEKVIPHIS